MKTICVGFSYHKSSPLSWLIRTVTKSKVSHTYATVIVGGEALIFQASGLMVNYTAEPIFAEKNVVVEEYMVEVTDEQWEKAKKIRTTQVGKPYSAKQLLGFFWVLGCRKFGKKAKNPFSDGRQSYVCCEIIADMIGIKDGEAMTPEDLRRWCEANSKRSRC